MISQVQQVALTLVTRRSLWLLGVFALLCFGPSVTIMLTGGRLDEIPPMLAAIGIGFPVAITCYVLSSQAKWQFCDSRARIMPHFAAPHISVLAAIAVAAYGAYPMALSLVGGWSRLGLLACAAVIAAGMTWTMHAGRWPGFAVAFAAYLSLMTERGLHFWTVPNEAAHWLTAHVALLFAGWSSIALWLVRLWRLREEDADYFVPVQAAQGSVTRMERTQARRAIARAMVGGGWNQRISDWWHDRLEAVRAATPRERRSLLNYGFATTPMWISAATMALMFFGMFYFMGYTGMLGRSGPNRSVLPGLNILIIMPTTFSAAWLMMRRGRMSQELLLPLDRRDYIDGLLMATARGAAANWATAHAALLALVAASAPEMLTTGFLAGLTALAASVQFFAFGAITLISLNMSGGKRLALMMAGVFVVSMPVLLGVEMLGHPGFTREQAVTQALTEEVSNRAALPADVRAILAADEQSKEQTIRSAELRWEREQPWAPVWITSVAATTAAIGVSLAWQGRKRMLRLELA